LSVKVGGTWYQVARYSSNFTAGTITANLTGNVTGNVSGTAGAVAWTNVTGKPTNFVYSDGGTYSLNITGNAATATSAGTSASLTSGSGKLLYDSGSYWTFSHPIDCGVGYFDNLEVLYIGSYGADFGNGNTLVRVSNGAIRQTASLRELKNSIEDITDGLSVIKQLKPRTFKWNVTSEDNDFSRSLKQKYSEPGFVAEEVEEVSQNLVFYNPDKNDNEQLVMWKPNSVIALLTKAVQELSARLDALEAQ
jgi:hypothetical protein